MAKRSRSTEAEHVSRNDLEQGFRSLQDGLRGQVAERKNAIITAAGAVGVVIVVVIFLLGRRSGKKKTTYVEIRRV